MSWRTLVGILLFVDGITAGAAEPKMSPDPHEGVDLKKVLKAMTLAEAKSFWAYQPIGNPKPPAVKNTTWPRHDLDRFVLATLEKEGLKPNPPADPRTLIRRLFFDLVGLPPTFEEIEKFAAAPTPEAFARCVDDLLSRPAYGQRWGRHWLDVARYSDTTEQSVDGERRIPFAHTYRDYVIEAFNSDKPFNRFIIEQIAADRLPPKEHADLRALGFLTVGRRFRGNFDAIQLVIDDRLDVIGRGFLGLTIACARCHDHKFDAISAADYYSLYGILASTVEPLDLPEVSAPPPSEAIKKYRAERAGLLQQYEAHTGFCIDKSNRLLREMAGDYLQYLAKTSPNHRTVAGFIPLDTPRGHLLPGGPARWESLLLKHRDHPFFRLWHELLALKKEDFAARSKEMLAKIDLSEGKYNALVVTTIQRQAPATMVEAASIYGKVIDSVLTGKTEDDRALAELLTGIESSLPIKRDEIEEDLLLFVTEHQVVLRPDGEKAGNLRQQLQTLEAGSPVERAMAVSVSAKPFEPRVFLRGEITKPGPLVPRRFPQMLAQVDSRTYDDDGRLPLAKAVASDSNPLTARVIVNRIWQHHFGRGLVVTPDDFGAAGAKPSHPELLDYLARQLVRDGGSIKKLHRAILLSATWQQSSASRADTAEKDPENRLLARMMPRRLEFEPLRDSLLVAAGRLDTKMGGRSELLTDTNYRRAVYGYTDRFRIPSLLRNFDVANPDTSISRRAETTHPLQALFFLNSPFVRAQAEQTLKRPEVVQAATTSDRVSALYRCIFSRAPREEEKSIAEEYLQDAKLDADGTRRWANFVQGLFFTNEFAFVD